MTATETAAIMLKGMSRSNVLKMCRGLVDHFNRLGNTRSEAFYRAVIKSVEAK